MLRYSLPLIPATMFWWVTNVSDRYMVTYMVSEAANGLYAVAYKTVSYTHLAVTGAVGILGILYNQTIEQWIARLRRHPRGE